MNLMRLTAKNRYFSAASACLLAIALMVGAVCGPACSGALCQGKSIAQETKNVCHGMATHSGKSTFLDSQPQTCSLLTSSVAALTKPVVAALATVGASNSAPILNAAHGSPTSLQSSRSPLRSKESPPAHSPGSSSTIVLRV